MIRFEEAADLAYYMLDLLDKTNETGVAAIVDKENVKDVLFYLLAEDVDLLAIEIDFDEYDKEYLVELSVCKDGFYGYITPAYNYKSELYFAPDANYILVDKEVANKCLIDIVSNPFVNDNPNFHRFYIDTEILDENDDIDDCENCPERFECPNYCSDDFEECCEEIDDDEEELCVSTNDVTIIKDTDGTIRGFTKMKSFIDENNVHSSFSNSFFSDDINAIRAAAKTLGIEL